MLGERVAEHSGLDVDVHVQPGLPQLGGDAELVLYRVAQEALTNVARHAGARRAEVRLELAGGRPRLEVDDDGHGFPPDGLEGGGVRGMRERAVLIGGSLRLAREPARRRARHPGAAARMSLQTRILLADDHAVVRRGLRLVLEGEPDLRVVAEAGDGAEAVERGLQRGRRPRGARHLDAAHDRAAGGARAHLAARRTCAC